MSVMDHGGEDRALPAIVYGLYLLGLVTFLTIPVGLVVAWTSKGRAGPNARSHFVFQVRTVGSALGWWIVGGLLLIAGAVLSIVLVGIPIFVVGLLMFAVGHVWFALRCLSGSYYLARGEPYPRPRSWLI